MQTQQLLQEEQEPQHEGEDQCRQPRVELELELERRRSLSRRDATTQTSALLDLTTLYQLLTDITLSRLDTLETIDKHLPSRDHQSPANQRRRTTSLPPTSDVTMTSQSARSRDSRSHHSAMSLLNLDVIFKRLRHSDVINTRRRPIRDHAPADVIAFMTSSKPPPGSSFKRLQQRRNGLTDVT